MVWAMHCPDYMAHLGPTDKLQRKIWSRFGCSSSRNVVSVYNQLPSEMHPIFCIFLFLFFLSRCTLVFVFSYDSEAAMVLNQSIPCTRWISFLTFLAPSTPSSWLWSASCPPSPILLPWAELSCQNLFETHATVVFYKQWKLDPTVSSDYDKLYDLCTYILFTLLVLEAPQILTFLIQKPLINKNSRKQKKLWNRLI